jgi:hypothetical protein
MDPDSESASTKSSDPEPQPCFDLIVNFKIGCYVVPIYCSSGPESQLKKLKLVRTFSTLAPVLYNGFHHFSTVDIFYRIL